MSKKWVVGVTSLLLIVLLLTDYLAVAAEYGSRNDPLVTLSYIEELLPELRQTIDDAIQKKSAEFDESIDKKIREAVESIDRKILQFEADYSADVADEAFIARVAEIVAQKLESSGASGDSPSSGGTQDLLQVVRFKSGQTVIGEVGTEILWRIGSAVCVSPGSPGLIDVTTGGDLPNGGSLQPNHLYVVTIEGRGFKTTSDCVILIKGPYTIK